MGIIYCWTNIITQKQYIGQTIDPEHRKRLHFTEAFKRQSDYYFHRSLRKYGLEAFKYEVLEEIDDPKELSKREAFHIQQKNTLWPNGYNEILPTHSMTEEMRKKISEGIKKSWSTRSPEQKALANEKRSRSLMGRKQSDHQKSVVRSANSKEWIVTFPDGHTERVTNLMEFARQHSDNPRSMWSNLPRCGYKGFKAVQVQNGS